MDGLEPPRRTSQRPLLRFWVWLIAVGWTIYLVAGEVHIRTSGFAVAVQVMGSLGILLALFLVMRPEAPTPEGGGRRPEGDDERPAGSISGPRWVLIMIILALSVGAVVYQLTHNSSLHQSTVFFIGVPAVLAITLSLTPKSKSATGVIIKGITLALLLSGIVFSEGFICIAMAAPLFYLVGLAVGLPIDWARRRKRSQGNTYSLVAIGLLLLSVEGAVPGISLPPDEIISVTKTIEAPVADVRAALRATPSFDEPLPLYLRMGFPRPIGATGQGLAVGDHRTIFFGDESPMEPMTSSDSAHHIHEDASEQGLLLRLRIIRSGLDLVVFEPVRDTTAFTHWITWGRSVVSWRAVDGDTTEVTWTLRFRRELSPSWYFGPFQRYAGDKAVGYLIESVATP